jgi:hypothetical protein
MCRSVKASAALCYTVHVLSALPRPQFLVSLLLPLGLPLLGGACDSSKKAAPATSASAAPRASASSKVAVAPVAEGLPKAPADIESVVNPKQEQPYSGPTGTVAGTVVIAGGQAPPNENADEIPPECLQARETYRELFREGMVRSLADVFVAVTGYSGYVPAKEDVRLIKARGCAFETRTVGVTYGQAIDVQSKDMKAYVPGLLGSRSTAQMVATPGGKPVRMYPSKAGRYVLVDSMRTFAQADVLVVAYATFDVTGMDGKFEIEDVPVGKVRVDALLPSLMLTSQEEVEVEEGKTTEVEFTLEFDESKWKKAGKKSWAVDTKAAAAPGKPRQQAPAPAKSAP